MIQEPDYETLAPVWKGWAVLCVFLFPATGGLLFGYDIGATSYVLNQLQSEDDSGVTWWHDVEKSSLIQGLIPSTDVAGALVGSIIVFKVADQIGRRREMQIAAVLYLVGAIFEMVSSNSSWGAGLGLTVLFAARFLYGIGCGFAMHGAPTYIAEMAPSEIRGTLVALKEAMIVVGMVLGYGIGFFLQHESGAWKFTYGASIPLAIFMLVGVTALPPSARWLAITGRIEEARASLNYVYSQGADDILSDIIEQIEAEKTRVATLGGQAASLFDARYRKCLVAGVGVVFLQQVTGQPSILYYANTIFKEAGMSSYAAVLTGVFKLFATLGSVVLVDKYGRRFLLFVGVSVMLVALVVMTVTFAGYETSDDDSGDDAVNLDWRTVTIIIGMFAYIGGYQLGFGPIAWLLISEVFPLEVRGQAVAFAVQNNFAWNLVVSLLYPVLIDSFGTAFGDEYKYCAGFGIFAVLTLYALVFIYRNVPETKGLSLEEIERKFCKDDGATYKADAEAGERDNSSLLGSNSVVQ
mmetsp:Transcript_40795/g.93914  ORF Transcript_40795/g.93914 Transcript_40795/m.93914 type:complete len:523 (+) Transcript_40795:103-1671(+)